MYKKPLNKKRQKRKYYSGPEKTGRQIRDLLPFVLSKVVRKELKETACILWKEILPSSLQDLTEIVSFTTGCLTVKVLNGVLYSSLVHEERERLLKEIQKRAPHLSVKRIRFTRG